MAGPYYVDNGGDGTTGAAWATAETIIEDGLTDASVAGDIIYVGHDTVDASSANRTLAATAGTYANPIKIISATQGSSPVAYQAGAAAQINVSAGLYDLVFTGNAYWQGIYFKFGDDFTITAVGVKQTFKDCIIEGTGSTSIIQVGNTTNPVECWLLDTDVKFTAASNGGDGFNLAGQYLYWWGGTLTWTAPPTAAMFLQNSGRNSVIDIRGVNLSAYNTAGYYFDLTSTDSTVKVYAANCVFDDTPQLYNGTVGKPGSEMIVIGCDDTTGNALYRHVKANYYGLLTSNTLCVRNSELSIYGTSVSMKMVANANAITYFQPFRSLDIEDEFSTTGAKTITVEIIHDNVTDLNDDEVWLEVEYLADAASTLATIASDCKASPTATAAPQTSSAMTWSGTDYDAMANPNTQKLEVSITVGRAGPFRARVCLAKSASYTIYYSPKPVIS